MILDLAEIVFGFCRCTGTKTFVVLDLPSRTVLGLFLPLFVFHHGEELQDFTIFGSLHDWGNELLQESLLSSEPHLEPQICHGSHMDVGKAGLTNKNGKYEELLPWIIAVSRQRHY